MNLISEIVKAWNVFRTGDSPRGWQVIPVSSIGRCKLMAAMAMPDLNESLFISFGGEVLSRPCQLPEGKGFTLQISINDGLTWLEITRTSDGEFELFLAMLENLLILLNKHTGINDRELFSLFIHRVQAWQDFMSVSRGVLSIERQTGLFGELAFLNELIDADLGHTSVQSWVGPNRGAQDFRIGYGAIEVKSTVSEEGFIAKIGSLDQLDDSVYSPIYLVGQRLLVSPDGITLEELIDQIHLKINEDIAAVTLFDDLLIMAGYLNLHAKSYVRRLQLVNSYLYQVDTSFPRIVTASVHKNIRSATYEIDLSNLPFQKLNLKETLKNLGVK